MMILLFLLLIFLVCLGFISFRWGGARSKGAVTEALAVAVPVAIILADPFGLIVATGQISETVSQRLYSILLDPGEPPSAPMMVIIDDADVDEIGGEGFPLTFNRHAKLLRTILCAGPSSLYIDIDFQRIQVDTAEGQSPADAVARLKRALTAVPGAADCGAEQAALPATVAAIPVYLARVRAATDECRSFPEDEASLERCRSKQAFESLLPAVRPITISTRDPDEDHLTYPLISNATNSFVFDDRLARLDSNARFMETEFSPATVMFLDRCRQGLADEGQQALCRDLSGLQATPFRQALPGAAIMVPTWRFYQSDAPAWRQILRKEDGSTPSDLESCRRYQVRDADGLGWRDRVALAAKAVVADGLQGVYRELFGWDTVFNDALCLTYPYVTARAVNLLSRNAEDAERARLLFHDKSVIYGYSVRANKDYIDSPVLGAVPGMVLHAAALDNLARLKTDYKRSWIEAWGVRVDGHLLRLVAMFALVAASGLVRAVPGTPAKVAAFLGPVAIVIVCAIAPFWLNLGPFDWLGAFAMWAVYRELRQGFGEVLRILAVGVRSLGRMMRIPQRKS